MGLGRVQDLGLEFGLRVGGIEFRVLGLGCKV